MENRTGLQGLRLLPDDQHVHLVIDPGDAPENLGLLMKRVAGRQTRYVNMPKNGYGWTSIPFT